MYPVRIRKPWLMVPEMGIAYCHIGKCGSTSITEALREFTGRESKHPTWACFEDDLYLSILDLWRQQVTKNYFTFAFVRNPYARIVSCFKDRIRRKNGRGFPHGFTSQIDFGTFLQRLETIFPGNQHIHPYWPWLMDSSGRVFPNFIGHLENFESDWQQLSECINIELPKIKRHNSTEKDDFRVYYTEKWMLDLVWRLYQEDFELFGYKRL